MVGPNKILTVSYGTFSCTLEGFEEPFSTMKAIAEYFRDLAAEDRYFGAEPPTPDAEMLHRIAEREIKRRVEARVQENGVILRPQITEAGQPAQAPTPLDEPSIRVSVGPRAEPVAATPLAAMAEAARPLEDEAAAISAISARLQRIREAVARGNAVTAPEPAAPAEMDTERLAAEEAAQAEAERVAAEEAAQAEAERVAAEEAAQAEAERVAAEEAAQAEAERIAAEEAAQAEAERIAAEEAAQAEAERIAAEEAAQAEAERIAAEEAAQAEAERVAAEEAAQAEAERVAAEEAAQAEAERIAAEEAAQAEAERVAAEEAAQAEAERIAAEEAAQAEAERVAAGEAAQIEAEPEAEARPVRRVVVVRPQAPAAPEPEAEPEAPLAAVAVPDDEDDAEEERRWAEAAERIARQAEDARLAREAQEAEAARLAELPAAELPTELPDENAAEPPQAEAETPAETGLGDESAALATIVENQRRAILQEISGEDAVARLISQTDEQLSGAEAQRRRSTLSHLKAAVLATRAEQEATGAMPTAGTDAAEIARYRADLAQTVRGAAEPTAEQPRRPERPAAQRTQRPANTQPPLVLVSEQRIDRPQSFDAVVPRRVVSNAVAQEELFDETAPIRAPLGRAFTDFVGPMQLTTVAELTEAAAAYLTHVAGHEDFARPAVMRLVMSTESPMTRSRENLLRAFGMLMRQGVLKRSRRGQFELAPESAFAEQARRFAAA